MGLVMCPSCSKHMDEFASTCSACGVELPAESTYGTPRAPELTRRELMRIDRYEILGELGGGAMGVVYAARDPELDRRVAVKLLKHTSPEARARLLGEAKAMARLVHPNVVVVFDAGVAEGDEVFVAMELVEGVTLRRWLAETPRGWRETLAAFRQAGEGLQAAHGAGLVHRDFKPDNVLHGSDGVVRVSDFGLARLPGDAALQSGGMIGTPAYMAPEQHRGGAVGPAADQFSFCVALYEALFGQRPFGGGAQKERLAAIDAGRVQPPSPGSRVPSWVRRAVVRGLAAAPEARWPSMRALVDRLARDPWVARRRAAGVVLAVGIGAAAVGLATPHTPPCRGVGKQTAAIWGREQKRAVSDAFTRSGKAYAADMWTAVDRALDDRVAAIAGGELEACQAAEVRREQSSALRDLRAACLADRERETEAVVRQLSSADEALVKDALALVRSLPDPAGCADAGTLGRRAPLPADRAARAAIDEIRAVVAEGGAATTAHRITPELTAKLAAAVARARELGYQPILAEALYQLGSAEYETNASADASKSLHDAIWAAEAGGADDVKALALRKLATVVGERQSKPAEGLELAHQAEATVERIGDARIASMLFAEEAVLYRLGGHADDSLAAARRALEQEESVRPPDDLGASVAVLALASAEQKVGKLDDALAGARRALALAEKALGPRHPSLIKPLTVAADILDERGDDAASLELLERARAIAEESLGPKDRARATILSNLVNAYGGLGRFPEAVDAAEKALALRESIYGPETAQVAKSLFDLGNAYPWAGRLDDGIAATRRALAIYLKVLPEGPDVVSCRINIGELLLDEGKAAEAAVELEAAHDRVVQLSADDPLLPYVLRALARERVMLGQAAAALPLAEQAVKIWEGRSVDPTNLGAARYVLAQAVWEGGGDRARARALATEAVEGLSSSAPGKKMAESARAWLDAHKP